MNNHIDQGVRHTARHLTLTPTEERVALLTAQGLRNREIGTELFMSPRTVETHLSRVFDKLGVKSRVQVAVWFARMETADTSTALAS
jgi:DNA-binding CsgD family transcriptional regulator